MQGFGNRNGQSESQSKNLELLAALLMEFSQHELDNEIFLLQQVAQPASTRHRSKGHGGPGSKQDKPQIILNEK